MSRLGRRAGTSSHSRVWRGGNRTVPIYSLLVFFTHRDILCPGRYTQYIRLGLYLFFFIYGSWKRQRPGRCVIRTSTL